MSSTEATAYVMNNTTPPTWAMQSAVFFRWALTGARCSLVGSALARESVRLYMGTCRRRRILRTRVQRWATYDDDTATDVHRATVIALMTVCNVALTVL